MLVFVQMDTLVNPIRNASKNVGHAVKSMPDGLGKVFNSKVVSLHSLMLGQLPSSGNTVAICRDQWPPPPPHPHAPCSLARCVDVHWFRSRYLRCSRMVSCSREVSAFHFYSCENLSAVWVVIWRKSKWMAKNVSYNWQRPHPQPPLKKKQWM